MWLGLTFDKVISQKFSGFKNLLFVGDTAGFCTRMKPVIFVKSQNYSNLAKHQGNGAFCFILTPPYASYQ
jgi:hypothetical protein